MPIMTKYRKFMLLKAVDVMQKSQCLFEKLQKLCTIFTVNSEQDSEARRQTCPAYRPAENIRYSHLYCGATCNNQSFGM